MPSAATGTSNCAAKASVFFAAWVVVSICQSPAIGSLTCTLIAPVLWLRSVISYATSNTLSEMRVKSVCLRSQITSNAVPIWSEMASSFGVWPM